MYEKLHSMAKLLDEYYVSFQMVLLAGTIDNTIKENVLLCNKVSSLLQNISATKTKTLTNMIDYEINKQIFSELDSISDSIISVVSAVKEFSDESGVTLESCFKDYINSVKNNINCDSFLGMDAPSLQLYSVRVKSVQILFDVLKGIVSFYDKK